MSRAATTREQAIARLRQCPVCQRWGCGATCDSCRVDRMPPTTEEALALLARAVALGQEAEAVRARLRGLLA